MDSEDRDVRPELHCVPSERRSEAILHLKCLMRAPLREVAVNSNGWKIDVAAEFNPWSRGQGVCRGRGSEPKSEINIRIGKAEFVYHSWGNRVDPLEPEDL